MKLFKEIDKKENKDKKLSFTEKAIIKTLIVFAKIILFKIGKAKTYGDLQFISKMIDEKITKNENVHINEFSSEKEVIDHIKKEFSSLE